MVCVAIPAASMSSMFKDVACVDVHGVLAGAPCLSSSKMIVIDVGEASTITEGTVSSDTPAGHSLEVTLRTSDLTSSERSTSGSLAWDVSVLREQHHHLTLVHETLTSVHLALHVPAVVTVADVDPADVRGLRTIHFVGLLSDNERVGTLLDFRLVELSRLVRALSVDVTDDDEL